MVRRPGHNVDGRFEDNYQEQSGGECESGLGSVVNASDQPQQPASNVSNNELLRGSALSQDQIASAIDRHNLSWGASLPASDHLTARAIRADRAPTPLGSNHFENRHDQSASNGAEYGAPTPQLLHNEAAKDGADHHRANPSPATDYRAANGGENHKLPSDVKLPRVQPGDGVQTTTLQRPPENLEPKMEPVDRRSSGKEAGVVKPSVDRPYTPADSTNGEAQHRQDPQAPPPQPPGGARPFVSPFANVVESLRHMLPARLAPGRVRGTRGNEQDIPPGGSQARDRRDGQVPAGGCADDHAAGVVPWRGSGSSPRSQASLGSALSFDSGAPAEAAPAGNSADCP